MTLRHLKIFVAVCQCGSMTKAAEKLYLAQPAVSLAISELEEYYHVTLFDRISRKLYLTDAGKKFLSYAIHITDLFDELEAGAKSWDDTAPLRIGSSITIGTHLLPEYIQHFSAQYPSIQISVTIDNSALIEAKLAANELDFALIEGIPHLPGVISEAFLDDRLVLVCSPKHPFREKDSICLEELKKERLLLRERGSGTRELLESTLISREISVTPAWESASTSAIIVGVEKGLGISVLPYQLVRGELDAGRLSSVRIADADFIRKFNILRHKNKHLTKPALAFLDMCRKSGAG